MIDYRTNYPIGSIVLIKHGNNNGRDMLPSSSIRVKISKWIDNTEFYAHTIDPTLNKELYWYGTNEIVVKLYPYLDELME